jgi:Methyltransferase FkbM domain
MKSCGEREEKISLISVFIRHSIGPNEKFGMGSIGPQFGDSPVMLKQRSLDGLSAEMNVQQIGVIKIDIEGSELGVLQGAGILGSERPPVILFEFADWAEARISGQQPGDVQAVLLSWVPLVLAHRSKPNARRDRCRGASRYRHDTGATGAGEH